jgi:hypothetical protein
MGKPITVYFNGGIHKPPKLGSLILRPTPPGKLAYAQNVQSTGLEYGEDVLVPGPALTTITNNSELTGIPFAKSYAVSLAAGYKHLYLLEGLLGNTNRIRRVENLGVGQTPSISTTDSVTVTHSGHSGVVLSDITARKNAADGLTFFIVGYDASHGWVQAFGGDALPPSVSAIDTLDGFTAGELITILTASDNEIYIFHGKHVDNVDISNTYSADAFLLPNDFGATDAREWNGLMAIAYCNVPPWDISQRKSSGESGIILWDMIDTTQFVRKVVCPSRYISAMINKQDGHLVVFGSNDAGTTTIYTFDGYGFADSYTYIGEPPRNRHSVEFDSQNNLIWQTLDGQICLFDFDTRKFEHITTIETTAGYGGVFGRLLGGTGNEFLAASGKDASPDTFNLSRITYGNYIGSTSETYATPKAVSGQQFVPPDSTISAITLYLTKKLASGEKIVLSVYEDGNTNPTEYLTMEYDTDGAIAAKRGTLSIPNISNFALELEWQQTNGAATAPPVAYALVEYETQY